MTFKQEINKGIGKVLLNSGHKLRIITKEVLYFSKRFSDDLAFYICCADSRKLNQGIEVMFYFTPVHQADDTIDRLGVGIKINLGNIMDEDIIPKATEYGNKILSIERNIGCYEDMILNEMKNPFVKSKRLEIYMTHDYKYYNCFKNCDEMKEKWKILHNNVVEDIRNNKFKKTEQLCKEFINSFDRDFLISKGFDVTDKFFDLYFFSVVCAQCELDA